MSAAALMAGLSGAAVVLGAWEGLVALERVPLSGIAGRLWDPLRRAGRDGRPASLVERRRAAALATGTLLAAGWLVAGPLAGMLAALGGPALAVALLRARRRRYSEELRAGAVEAARALADAIGAGHSARGALLAAAPGLAGATGRELRAAAAALELGEPTEHALERLRRRARCPAWDALTAAILLARDAGGDLAALLRRLAASLEEAERLDAEARTATAQARFTAWLVAGLPFAAAGLGELASPGMVAGLLAHPLSASLAGVAVALQVVAILCIRRIARPPARR